MGTVPEYPAGVGKSDGEVLAGGVCKRPRIQYLQGVLAV